MATAHEQWKTFGVIKTPGIPAPSGEYNVGCVDLMEETGLLVRLFYPTAADGLTEEFKYAKASPDPKYTKAFCQNVKIRPAWLVSSRLVDPRSPALERAPLYKCPASRREQDTEQSPQIEEIPIVFPVVVFSHGLHAFRTVYSGVCCNTASHGYVVAAVEHKDQSACVTFNRIPGPGVTEGDYDRYINKWIPELIKSNEFSFRNQQLQQRQSEVSKSLDLLQSLNEGTEVGNLMGGTFDLSQFIGRLDTNKAAVMGHSFGGATTIKTLVADSRFMCGIALDTWMSPVDKDIYDRGINQPLIFINSYSFQWAKNVSRMMRLVTPPNEAGISRCSLVTLKGTTHFTQSDIGFTMPSFIGKKYVTENSYKANTVNSELTTAFLKRYLLKGILKQEEKITYSLDFPDPSHQGTLPLLDGKGGSEFILYGTNIDWKEGEEQEKIQKNAETTPTGMQHTKDSKEKSECKGDGSEEACTGN